MQPRAGPVAIIDSVPVYRKGLVALCEAAGLPTVEVFALGDLPSTPGAIVSGVRMETDWTVLEDYCAREDAQPFVALLPALSELAVERALAAGASGTLQIDASGDELVRVINAALSGNTLLPQGLMRQIAQDATQTRGLSSVEISWLRELAGGLTVSALADKAGYSEREMHRHLSGVYSRLGVRHRTEALLHAERLGLLAGANRTP